MSQLYDISILETLQRQKYQNRANNLNGTKEKHAKVH
jgi:hypothetical protein